MYTIVAICDRSIHRVVKTDKTYLEAIELANDILKEYLKTQDITEQSEIDELIKDEELEFMSVENEIGWYNGKRYDFDVYLIE